MTTQLPDIKEAARLWAVRVGDPAFGDWDRLTLWLEADPAHLAAYEAVVADEEWADEALARTPAIKPKN